MKLQKFKPIFYIFTFLLIVIVSAAMKKPEQTVPPVSSAILLVGVLYGGIFLLIKLGRKIKND